MDVQLATLIGILATVVGQCFVAYLQFKSRARIEDIHVATNGMKAQLEAQAFKDGEASGEKKRKAKRKV